jgi:glycosyltransferase involved in cell wall biosynthesis
MEREPSFSLIIPAYNEENYIGPCLDALFQNAKDAFSEIIVVDNASTDKTAQIAASYPGVKVIHEPRKGTSSARQSGFLASSGDILVFVDADTRPPAGWIEKVKGLFEDPSVVGVSGPYYFYDLSPGPRKLVALWYIASKILSYAVTFVIGGNFAIRRDVLEKLGGFDENIEFWGDDVDIGRRAHAFGKVVYSLRLTMPSSARRLKAQGLVGAGKLYVKNLYSVATSGKPTTLEHEDFR